MSTGTGKTNTCRPNDWAQVFLCTHLRQQYVKRSTCMDFGLLDLTPTQGKIFHTITMTKKEPNLPPSGRSPTSCLPSFSCCIECMGRGSPSWLCHTVPKNSEWKVPNGYLKVPQVRLNSFQNRTPETYKAHLPLKRKDVCSPFCTALWMVLADLAGQMHWSHII